MPLLIFSILLLLSITSPSSGATYCLCKDGVGESSLQKSIDYACANGADCTPITQGGSCFNPNTVKDHCNYAVNSYFQKRGQISGSCDFSGTATPSANPPTPSTGCVYPSSGSGGTPTTPGTSTPPGTGTPVTGTPGTGTPSTGTPAMGTPGTSTGNGTGTGTPSTTIPGGSIAPPFGGLAPTTADGTGSASARAHQNTNLFCSATLALLFSGLMFLTRA